jgi:hypothetical protein
MCLPQVVELLKALLTPAIALLAAYIAWQQWQTNRTKLALDLYDRRVHIYEQVKRILSMVMRDARVSYEDLLAFRANTAQADFLFGPEIPKYIDEIYQRAVKLEYWTKEYRDYTQEKPAGYDHEKVVAGKHAELEWLSGQFEPALKKFRPYLHVGKRT